MYFDTTFITEALLLAFNTSFWLDNCLWKFKYIPTNPKGFFVVQKLVLIVNFKDFFYTTKQTQIWYAEFDQYLFQSKNSTSFFYEGKRKDNNFIVHFLTHLMKSNYLMAVGYTSAVNRFMTGRQPNECAINIIRISIKGRYPSQEGLSR